jgi:primosomal protein N' (replication factor Y) (superfamily II helicase)
MFVIEVVPLRRGIGIDTLSYFGSESYPIGTLLSIPVRSQVILGLVTNVNEVSAAKTALRAATFSLRRLPLQESVQTLSPAYIKTAELLGNEYGTHIGNILFNLLPPEIQRGDVALPHTLSVEVKERHIPELLQATREERYATYRSLVRETFAHGSSVLLVAPTSTEAEELRRALERGIEDRIILLTSVLGKRDLKKAYEALEDFSHAKLIIATPSHALIERHDVTRVILEESRSPHYKERVRPYLDYRDVIRIHAGECGRRLLFGDLLPRTEEEEARREDRMLTLGETPKRLQLPGKLNIVTMPEKMELGKTLPIFTEEMSMLIKEVRKKKSHLFIFSARRGLSPVVACQDCGHIFRSPESGAPYSLLRVMKNGAEERFFVCSTSGERVRAADVCTQCGSWKLRERGIGIQYVHDELRKIAKDTPLVLFDHTTATTYKKAHFLKEAFYGTKGAIMLGTYMALPYLTEPIENALIVSMDALLTTPTWRLEEENLALLLRLRETTTNSVFLQSKSKDHDLFSYAKHAEVERFYTDEISLRKTFNYPPFAHFIHLTWQDTAENAKKIEEVVTTLLTPFGVTTYQSPLSPKNSIVLHGLIRTQESLWPNPEIVSALKQLPPSIRVVHNPDRIV